MADFYEDMANVTRELLAPTSQGGLGQGNVVLSRKIPGTPDPDAPWLPVEDTFERETLLAAVRGVSKELVGTEAGSTVILASDRQAICAPIAMGYTAGDTLIIDDIPVHIVAVQNIPAAGITSAIRFIIRG